MEEEEVEEKEREWEEREEDMRNVEMEVCLFVNQGESTWVCWIAVQHH